MIPFVPVVTRISGVSNEAIAAHSAEDSIFSGRAVWGIDLFETLERCVFAQTRNVGFFIIDGTRESIGHFQDADGSETTAALAMIQASAEGQEDGYSRYTFTATGDGPSSPWIMQREAGAVLNSQVVAPSLSPVASQFESAVLSQLNPSVPAMPFVALLRAILSALHLGSAVHWIVLASQRSSSFVLWASPLTTASFPDFTTNGTGNATVDSSWGFTARKPE